MKDMFIIDNALDEREFRNYISSLLKKENFQRISIDDERISDEYITNDNDIKATKGNQRYTIQTFLNKDITASEIHETENDMIHENLKKGLIITNKKVIEEVKELARDKNIEIWDRTVLDEKIKI